MYGASKSTECAQHYMRQLVQFVESAVASNPFVAVHVSALDFQLDDGINTSDDGSDTSSVQSVSQL